MKSEALKFRESDSLAAEGDSDIEPSLGHHPYGVPIALIDCEGDERDGREPDEDLEPSLAHTLKFDQERVARQLRPICSGGIPWMPTWRPSMTAANQAMTRSTAKTDKSSPPPAPLAGAQEAAYTQCAPLRVQRCDTRLSEPCLLS